MEDFNGNHIGGDCIEAVHSPQQKSKDWFGRKEKVEISTSPSNGSETNNIRWSEIEEDGALYNTALKRVRYNSFTSDDSTDGNVSFKQWETVKIKQIKAGTLEKLVEYLTPATMECNEFDPGFLLAFLCTYKSFATTCEVVELMLKRFEYCENNLLCDSSEEENYFKGIMKRICSVITILFDQYPYDFDEPPMYPTISSITAFTEKRSHLPGMEELHNASKEKLDILSVSPFHYEAPYKFKFCSCPTIVGCTCDISICPITFEHHQSLNVNKFSAEMIAEQLTLADSELFIKVSPRECLGSFWSKRDPSKGSMSQSIKLTVDQFNAVSLKVISTILTARNKQTNHLSPSARCKVIEKWIEVALELRELKNFSSLKAILSSLQSSAIYRLTRTWAHIRKQCIEIYGELSKIFVDDMNNKASRDLLMQEGTAKYSTHTLKKSYSKRDTWKKEGMTYGTIPYLGTFLTDLMMIDTAHPDKCKGDLINFEKRRKEFEIIIQIRLFQQAAKNYHLKANKDFFIWFNGIPEYSDKEGYNKSLEVEAPIPKDIIPPSTPQPKRRGKQIKRCKSESDIIHEQQAISSLSSSESTSSILNNNKTSMPDNEAMTTLPLRTSLNPLDVKRLDTSFLVARVYLEDSVGAEYKSIKLYSETRACDVISVTLRKFNATEELTQFSLYQILDNDKTLHIPMNSNMYYAMSKCKKDICFKVCKKRFGKKWRTPNNQTKLSSFHNHLRKSKTIDTGDYGIMFHSYLSLS